MLASPMQSFVVAIVTFLRVVGNEAIKLVSEASLPPAPPTTSPPLTFSFANGNTCAYGSGSYYKASCSSGTVGLSLGYLAAIAAVAAAMRAAI